METNMPSIAVIGAGAVGSLTGGLLASKGMNVTLIGRGGHCAEIMRSGLKISGVRGERTVKVRADEKLNFRPDIVFLCMKTQDLAASCAQIKAFVQDSLIVTMQNGIHADRIVSDVLGTVRIIGAIVQFNALYLVDGKVVFGADGPVILGDASGRDAAGLEKVRKILGTCFEVAVNRDIAAARCMKLLVNIMANSLAAVSGLTAAEYMQFPVYRRLAVELLRESCAVLKKAGIRPATIPGLSRGDLALMARLPKKAAARLIARSLGQGRYSATRASTLQSLMRGKTTEVDALNGEIVSIAAEYGSKAPFNAEIIRQCRRIEKEGSFLSATDAETVFFTKKTG
ncbi:MAG: ketopantoate reductase family protein [Spirochaetales bacterium]|nr:ketopantoate reductase family protein [Spirochaetales bacterium]